MDRSSEIVNRIRKNDDNFSFLSTFFELIGNKKFKEAEVKTLYTTNMTNKTSIWRALSAVGEEHASKFYESIKHFSDNILNISTCKVKLLQSMIQMTGVNYTIFSDLDNIPYEVLQLIDVFSIKEEYLTSDMMNGKFKDEMLDIVLNDDTISASLSNCLSTNNIRDQYLAGKKSLSAYWNGINMSCQNVIDKDKLDNYIYLQIYTLLDGKLNLTYNSKSEKPIYKELSSEILENASFSIPNEYSSDILQLKIQYNIDSSFDVDKEADKIDNLQTVLSDYSQYEQEILQYELKRRSDAYIKLEPKTRYKYYRELDFKKYVDYINNTYFQVSSNYLSSSVYDVDNNYILIFNIADSHNVFKYTADEDKKDICIDGSYIHIVANYLCYVIKTIRDIREQIKSQYQLNYLRGTLLIVQYLIQMFIKSNIANDLANLSIDYEFNLNSNTAEIIEYLDPVEYFNLCSDTDATDSNVNSRFWEKNDSTKRIGAIDNTNIFEKLPTYNSENFEFSLSDISQFYIDLLDLKFISSYISSDQYNLNNFLNCVYAIGADETFLSDGTIYDNGLLDRQKEYETLCATYAKDYQSVSEKYGNISSYVNDELEQNDKTLSEQLSQLRSQCIADVNAVIKIDTLSAELSRLGELDTKVELTAFTEYLASKQYISISESQNEIDEYKQSDFYAYKTNLFKKYIGLSVGSTPYYYIENQRHPSFQSHAYLSNFIEKSENKFVIKNSTNIDVDSVNSLLNVNDICSYIDDDGYLIDIWKNPLNTNTDYLSRYESVSHTDENNNLNPTYGYDGFCYPPAIDALSNESSINILTSLISNNKEKQGNIVNYYYGLNLSQNQRDFICNQIKVFGKLIHSIATAKHEAIYDIYKYGTDLYSNSYILLKLYGDQDQDQPKDDSEKRTMPGSLWIRFNNHPYAFPAYSNAFADYLQVDSGSTNKAATELKYDDDTYKFPKIFDFTFNDSYQDVLLLGLKNCNSYDKYKTIVCRNRKYYNNNKAVDRYLYYLDQSNNLNTLEDDSDALLSSDWTFLQFYQTSSKLGVVYTNITDNEGIKALMWYYNLNSSSSTNRIVHIGETILDKHCPNDKNVCTDIYDDTLVIAYVHMLDNQLCNYLGSIVTYDSLSAHYKETFNKEELSRDYLTAPLTIVTKQFSIYNGKLFEINGRDVYARYSDIGCFGLSTGNNDISSSYIMKELTTDRGMYKFLLFTDKKDNCIDFKFFTQVRMHESYTHTLSGLSASFGDVHFYEPLNSDYTNSLPNYSSLSNSIETIYDPVEFKKYVELYYPMAQVDESFKSDDIYDEYVIDPYIISSTDKIPDEYKTNYGKSTGGTDTCILSLTDKYDQLSVSWYYDSANKQIHLDFNTYYYNDHSLKSKNERNKHHLFLNLDKPGAAGYLFLYDNPTANNLDSSLCARVYLKNISDKKPKFAMKLIEL